MAGSKFILASTATKRPTRRHLRNLKVHKPLAVYKAKNAYLASGSGDKGVGFPQRKNFKLRWCNDHISYLVTNGSGPYEYTFKMNSIYSPGSDVGGDTKTYRYKEQIFGYNNSTTYFHGPYGRYTVFKSKCEAVITNTSTLYDVQLVVGKRNASESQPSTLAEARERKNYKVINVGSQGSSNIKKITMYGAPNVCFGISKSAIMDSVYYQQGYTGDPQLLCYWDVMVFATDPNLDDEVQCFVDVRLTAWLRAQSLVDVNNSDDGHS